MATSSLKATERKSDRLEAFVDAVLAIAITLPVTELHAPEPTDGDPARWMLTSANQSRILSIVIGIGTRQYARLVDQWIRLIDLEPAAYGTHSLRRTTVSLVYKKTGNLRACQLLLGHRKLESTVRYLGIEVDDALELSEQIDL